MSTLNLPDLQRLVQELANARAGRAKAQRLVDVLQMKEKRSVVLSLMTADERNSDKETDSFRLIDADLYSHRITAGRDQLLKAMQRFAQEQLIAWNSKVEGLEFQIRRVTRG